MAIQIREKRSTLDTIGQIVGIGQGVLGAVNTISAMKDKSDEKERNEKGILTKKDALTAFPADKFEDAKEGDAGAIGVDVQEGSDIHRRLYKAKAEKPKMETLSPEKQAEVQARMVPPGTKGAREFAAMMPDGKVGSVWLTPPKEKDPNALDPDKIGSVPGYAVAPGARPTLDDAKQVKAAGQALETAKQNINELRALLAKHGTETTGPASDQMRRLITDLKFQYKDIAGLGVLSAQDMEELDKMVPDTTRFFQRQSTASANLDQFEAMLQSKLAKTAQVRGFVPANMAKAPPPKDPAGQTPQYTIGGKPATQEQLQQAAIKQLEKLGVAWQGGLPGGKL